MTAIALDGPAASGKSAVGAQVAAKLGFVFYDTGAMYRALTWHALKRGRDLHDEDGLGRMAQQVSMDVRAAPADAVERTAVLVDGDDATPYLREPSVERGVSLVARVPAVRMAMVRRQRELAAADGVVMAGRDIGTVVLPGAGLKIYLDASPRVRAERRAAQMRDAGVSVDVDALTLDLTRRDAIDSTRSASPLTAAPDAVIINTDRLSIDEVVSRIVDLAT